MTYTLATLAYMVAREIGGGVLREGNATGGSTTTIVDANRRTEADDYWNGGTAWIVEADGVAPEGEVSYVTDFANATGTITLEETLTATVQAGDIYAICKKRYPYEILRQMVNAALTHVGKIPYENTSLTTAVSQTEYQLSDAMIGLDLRKVEIATNDDSDDNRWLENTAWSLKRSATGTADYLVFRRQPPDGYTIRLTYVAVPGDLQLDTDKLNEKIHPDRIIYRAACEAIKWYRDKTRLKDFDQKIAELENKALEAALTYPIPLPVRPTMKVRAY